jgi:acetyl esterase/lipase
MYYKTGTKKLKKLLGLILVLSITACAETPELIENNNPERYNLANDVVWASPDGVDLTMDIYTPVTEQDLLPVIVMFHGGGWLINDESIMDQAAKYLATNSQYVVCNVNYRLLVDSDNTVTINQIVEDAFGAVLWVKDNIADYRGDPGKISVTGDSAGGHLSAMIVNLGDKLSSKPYSEQSLMFRPSYLPHNQSAEQVAMLDGLAVQAAVLSYGAYDLYESSLGGFEEWKNPFWLMAGVLPRRIFGEEFNAVDYPDLYRGVSPSYNIPEVVVRKLPPQLLTVGSEDSLVTPSSVKAYMQKLVSAGQSAQYWEHEGRPHAFLDSGSNLALGLNFEADAPPALDVMIAFLDEIFYPPAP